MKTKLMFAVLAAAAVFTACTKEDPTMEPSKTLKSVEISLDNLIYTKGAAGNKITAGDPVQVNDVQIFLVKSDGTFFTGAKQANGSTAAAYKFTGAVASKYEFHYVDTDVNKVVVVANMGADFTATNYADLQTKTLAIDVQQTATNLALYGEGGLTKSGNHSDTDTNNNVQDNQVYTSNVTIVPRVARIEVDGFRVIYTEDDPATKDVVETIYDEITFTQLAMVNYMPTTALWNGTESGTLVNPLATYYSGSTVSNETAIYNWLGTKPEGTPTWTYDACELTCTPPTEDDEEGVPAADFETPRAYNIFAGNVVPTFFIHLTADGVPAFLYTKSIKVKGEDNQLVPLTAFAEGTIYRMSGATTSLGDGAIEIPEDKINPMDRCLDITVEVEPWQVVLVTPEF
jgi:hypothetical protein